jgi:hypothetical protein
VITLPVRFPTGAIEIQSDDPATAPLAVRGATAQTASLQEWRDAENTTIASVNAYGDLSSDYVAVGGVPAETAINGRRNIRDNGGTIFIDRALVYDHGAVVVPDAGDRTIQASGLFINQSQSLASGAASYMSLGAAVLHDVSAADGESFVAGIFGGASVSKTDTFNVALLAGLAFQAFTSAPETSIAQIIGALITAGNYGGELSHVADLRGIFIEANSSDGPVDVAYGVYVGDQRSASTMAAWALWTGGGAHRLGDYVDIAIIETPPPPDASHVRMFPRDNGGVIELCIQFSDGTIAILASH